MGAYVGRKRGAFILTAVLLAANLSTDAKVRVKKEVSAQAKVKVGAKEGAQNEEGVRKVGGDKEKYISQVSKGGLKTKHNFKVKKDKEQIAQQMGMRDDEYTDIQFLTKVEKGDDSIEEIEVVSFDDDGLMTQSDWQLGSIDRYSIALEHAWIESQGQYGVVKWVLTDPDYASSPLDNIQARLKQENGSEW